MDSVSVAGLTAWTPTRVSGSARDPSVEWAMVDRPYAEPFFEQTVERAMQHPFNQVFARTTPLGALEAFADEFPPAEPAGFVFHMSRCGSTLIAQMLSRLSDALVVSEAQPLDGVLRLHRAGALDGETAGRLLRGLLAALGCGRHEVRRSFVKFHAWHVFDLPLLARTFPDTPWMFAFREPRAVLRSQERIPGAEIFPGASDPRLAGIEPAALATISPGTYAARMLAAFCTTALECASGRGMFLDYVTLPEAVFTRVLPFFGVTATGEEAARMHEVAAIDAKSSGKAYRAATVEPPASPEIERLAAEWLDAVYAALRGSLRVR